MRDFMVENKGLDKGGVGWAMCSGEKMDRGRRKLHGSYCLAATTWVCELCRSRMHANTKFYHGKEATTRQGTR